MTEARIRALSYKDLKEYALKVGVKNPHMFERESLCELVLEAIEEDKSEREIFNNAAIRVEEKKYDVNRADDEHPADAQDAVLPERYNETKITLLLRDPQWAFAYWDIQDTLLHAYKRKPGFDKMFLRVYELSPGDLAMKVLDFFDIPVKLSDTQWYINLPRAGRDYYLELMVLLQGEEKSLCRSNIITSPKKTILDAVHEVREASSLDDLMVLYGFYTAGESSYTNAIPQRILSMIDAAKFNWPE